MATERGNSRSPKTSAPKTSASKAGSPKPTASKRGSPKASRSRKSPLACVVLAAGQGTRMRSARAKVLHELLGRPLVAYPIDLSRAIGADPVVAVLGHQREKVEEVLNARYGAGAIRIAEQKERHGTGHALRMALPALRGARGILLVLSGDVPLVQQKTLSALVGTARRYACLAVLTTTPRDPTGYGRIVRDSRGHVLRIVEHKDATAEERAVTEVNAGIYAGPIEFFREALPLLQARNAQHEYYLTDIVTRAAESIGVSTVEAEFKDVGGVNDRAQLVEAEAMLRARVNARWMAHATFRDAASTVIEPDVVIGVDVELGRGVALRGRTRIGHGARIGDGCLLTDTDVGAGAEVRPYSVATEAVIGVHAKVGPFAHLRPGAVLGADAHVGNFVELKKTRLGRGSKANHLTYLGDATVGDGVNIGAGTITCNYNGYEKTQTIIEDGAFIGSDSQLVAPVTIGRKAVVAAGTTVTNDVPPGALAIGRVPQVAVEGYAQKLARRYDGTAPAQKRGSRVSG
jgi:bifunctional UDP-N-acetylglucosamine pyrophosphorylase/glucosamine-1-phosphate N-acetyltransferase